MAQVNIFLILLTNTLRMFLTFHKSTFWKHWMRIYFFFIDKIEWEFTVLPHKLHINRGHDETVLLQYIHWFRSKTPIQIPLSFLLLSFLTKPQPIFHLPHFTLAGTPPSTTVSTFLPSPERPQIRLSSPTVFPRRRPPSPLCSQTFRHPHRSFSAITILVCFFFFIFIFFLVFFFRCGLLGLRRLIHNQPFACLILEKLEKLGFFLNICWV